MKKTGKNNKKRPGKYLTVGLSATVFTAAFSFYAFCSPICAAATETVSSSSNAVSASAISQQAIAVVASAAAAGSTGGTQVIAVATPKALAQASNPAQPISANGAPMPVSPEAGPMYKKALADYKSGDMAGAYEKTNFILDNYISGKMLNCDVHYLLGRALFKMGHFFEAKPYFQKIISADPDYKDIYGVIFYMAKSDFNMKNHRRSIRDFYFLLQKTEKGSELYDKSLVYLTLSYASSGRYKEADKLYAEDDVKTILKKMTFLKTRNNYFKLVYLDYLIKHRKDLRGAMLVLNYDNLFAAAKDDDCYKAYYDGQTALEGKKYSAAQHFFAESSKSCSGRYYQNSILYYGIASAGLKDYAGGIKYVKSALGALDYPGTRLEALKFLANFYGGQNKPETEIKYVKRILFNYPYLPETIETEWRKKAAGLLGAIIKKDYKSGKNKDAFKSLRSIGFLIPSEYMEPEINLYLSKIRLKEGNLKEALSYAEKYNESSQSPASEYYIADICYKSKDYKKSLAYLNRIDLKKPRDIKLIKKIAGLRLELYKRLGMNGNYVKLLKSSIGSLPQEDKIKGMYFLGTYEYNGKNLRAADFYFRQVIKNAHAGENKNKDILYGTYYYLGLINYSFGNYKAALEYFKNGYDLNPSGTDFEYELSQIAYIYLRRLNDSALALKYYNLLEQNASSATYKSLASTMIAAINMQK